MADRILFYEKQRFTQWWLWLLLLVTFAFPLFGIFREMRSEHPFSNPEDNTGFIISLVVLSCVAALFFIFRLETQITNTGINARFFPLHLKYQQFRWTEMEQVYVRKYSPISEFGGWGLRYSLSSAGKAYNISGNQGIQIVFKDGKKLLIGTNKPEEAAEALKQFQPVKS